MWRDALACWSDGICRERDDRFGAQRKVIVGRIPGGRRAAAQLCLRSKADGLFSAKIEP